MKERKLAGRIFPVILALALLSGLSTIGGLAADGGPKPPPPQRGQANQYSVEQAISDNAQLNTIAFDGLAFLTGTAGADSFFPPGKVADFFGFQYMRDIDQGGLGHNTTFLSRIASNVLKILTTEQTAQLIALAKEQEQLYKDFALKRFPLMNAFRRNLEGNLPTGTSGLSLEAVKQFTADLYAIDAQLSYGRAKVNGGIIASLSAAQKAAFAKLSFNNSDTWPDLPETLDKKSLTQMQHVAVMTYASEFFSWYAGSLEADIYFCPERHGTYFGGFYMKDYPAMGNPDYFISTSLTGDSGEAFLAALTETQRARITGIIDAQRQDINAVVALRRQIATSLRQFMQEKAVDKDSIVQLVRKYGELDGAMSYLYATRFAEVNKTLTSAQRAKLIQIRNQNVYPKGAYQYSDPIGMPTIINTDFLFK